MDWFRHFGGKHMDFWTQFVLSPSHFINSYLIIIFSNFIFKLCRGSWYLGRTNRHMRSGRFRKNIKSMYCVNEICGVSVRACLVKGGSEEGKKWGSGNSSLWILRIGCKFSGVWMLLGSVVWKMLYLFQCLDDNVKVEVKKLTTKLIKKK